MKRLFLLIAMGFLLLPGPSVAVEDAVKEVGKTALDVVFSETEKRVMDRYYKERRRLLGQTEGEDEQDGDDDDSDDDNDAQGDRKSKQKKGQKHKKQAKRKDLPPGIRKKLERGGELPPGLAKRDLPVDLERDLPPAPEGHERAVVDNKVVLIDSATGVIKDIFRPRRNESGETVKKQPRANDETATRATQGSNTEPKKSWWEFWK